MAYLTVKSLPSAQWLRDTANQFPQYGSIVGKDPELTALIKAVINTEARYISQYPYCGAFQPPPESGLPPSFNYYAVGVTVNPYVLGHLDRQLTDVLNKACGPKDCL